MKDVFPTDERSFIRDVVGLQRRIQSLYDETRSLAQQCRWDDHIQQAVLLLGCLNYLGWQQWVSRILGRMAWSYIRLEELEHARKLLELAETRDPWQAAANYYWASEYSVRANHDTWAKEFTEAFRGLCTKQLGIPDAPDLELAVSFYERLVQQEALDPLFADKNNQSDLGRYLELRGRLSMSPQDFWDAALHYELAGLRTYAASARSFYFISKARTTTHPPLNRLAFYRDALTEVNGVLFADRSVSELLRRYLETSIACCELVGHCEQSLEDSSAVVEIEKTFRRIHELVRGSGLPRVFESPESPGGPEPLAALAARFVRFSQRRAWVDLLSFMEALDTTVCSTDPETAHDVLGHFEGLQPFLPSLSFLSAPEEELSQVPHE